MKEKIGIEKLLELLNEYEDVKTWYATYTTRGEQSEREIKSDYMFDEDQNIIQIYIISKDFGFIKWLVEHNKLLHPDFVLHLKLYFGDSMPEENFYLMMLAISPNPIEELCKMLRPN